MQVQVDRAKLLEAELWLIDNVGYAYDIGSSTDRYFCIRGKGWEVTYYPGGLKKTPPAVTIDGRCCKRELRTLFKLKFGV